ncbi:hypothetical protein HZ326_30674 [Fusarium oxysporum f. sp. albedinis]|nr:hypothetical protein HZ326_30674 [Fusarium oxysporum f. sp. albedinis]
MLPNPLRGIARMYGARKVHVWFSGALRCMGKKSKTTSEQKTSFSILSISRIHPNFFGQIINPILVVMIYMLRQPTSYTTYCRIDGHLDPKNA